MLDELFVRYFIVYVMVGVIYLMFYIYVLYYVYNVLGYDIDNFFMR